MRDLKHLYLKDCHLGDRGVRMIVDKLEEFLSGSVDLLDLSANQIGQSSYFRDSAASIVAYLIKATTLNDLFLNHNMLRGPLGYNIIEAISNHMNLSTVEMNNNFLGQEDRCVEPPAVLLGRMLIYSTLLERLDISYN